MTLWKWRPPAGGDPSLDPPPLTPRDADPRERGRMGTNSTRLHTRTYPQRINKAIADEDAHELQRAEKRLIRRAIAKLIHLRSTELGRPTCACDPKACRHVEALWAGYGRRVGSCEYAKPFRNALTGTEVAFPFSCRVPGCPHCEGERVDELRRRFLPLVEAAERPRVAYLTMRNLPAGGLAAGWSAIGAAFARLWRSPLFAAVDHCTTPKQRAARRHVGDEPCHGHRRRCRAGKVGCLAAIDGADLELRRECAGRCRRAGDPHEYCRPCPGHRPATAALLSLEATVNRREATWHPHANLLFAGDYIPNATLAAAWARALGAPVAFTWIRDATRPPRGWRGRDWTVKKALHETVKYSIKPDSKLIDTAAPRWYAEWVEARRGRRLVRSYGDWFGVADLETEDPATAEQTVAVIDDDGRSYRLPVLDPITDDVADWTVLPGDAPRSRYLRVTPPASETCPRRAWLVTHPMLRPPPIDQAVPDG